MAIFSMLIDVCQLQKYRTMARIEAGLIQRIGQETAAVEGSYSPGFLC